MQEITWIKEKKIVRIIQEKYILQRNRTSIKNTEKLTYAINRFDTPTRRIRFYTIVYVKNGKSLINLVGAWRLTVFMV
jgi:hypothetical protein